MNQSTASIMLAEFSRDPLIVEREKTHGSFEWNAFVSQRIKSVFRNCPGYDGFSDGHKEALDMIALKLARLMQNPNHEDHWMDIAGYATLGLELVEVKK